jgi:hypothetical protein
MKITPNHLARGASGSPPPTSLPTIMRGGGVNMASPKGPVLSGGRMSRSSMMILAARVRASAVRALSGCSR